MISEEELIDEYINLADWKVKENANTVFSFSGIVSHIKDKAFSNYALSKIYTKEIADAHRKGFFHIHDLGNSITGYCSGWSLYNLLLMGFGGAGNVISRPAKHFGSLIGQIINFVGCLQLEWAGAQAFSSIDTLCAPFIRADNLTYQQVKRDVKQLIYSLNVPSRWACQSPFSNLTLDWTADNTWKDKKIIIGGVEQETTYGEYQKEMDMFNKAFLEVLYEGDGEGRPFTFPIPTINITNTFDWDGANNDLLWKVTGKYGSPYFMNYVGTGLDPNTIHAMCCRLHLDKMELIRRPGGMWNFGDGTGSVGVVTINLNRIGCVSKTRGEFFRNLRTYMDLAKESLEKKRLVVQDILDRGLLPFTKRFVGKLDNYFNTIGLIGMNECCLNFLGKDITTNEGLSFTIEVLNFMKSTVREYQRESGALYNLEATPAEGASHRLALLDKNFFPDAFVAGDNGSVYLTNSTQIPVNKQDDLVSAIIHQSTIQHLYTGGTVFHLWVGEEMNDTNAVKNIVKKMCEKTSLPYFTLTPTFSICKVHGYIKGKKFSCPTCNMETDVYSRVVGYYRPVNSWHKGKRKEFEERIHFYEDQMEPVCENGLDRVSDEVNNIKVSINDYK